MNKFIFLEKNQAPRVFCVEFVYLRLNKRMTRFEVIFCSGCKPNSVVVGIELSGDPKYDGRKFLPLFADASRAGLSTTLHLAEVLPVICTLS